MIKLLNNRKYVLFCLSFWFCFELYEAIVVSLKLNSGKMKQNLSVSERLNLSSKFKRSNEAIDFSYAKRPSLEL